uniref:C-type lectin domain-containing protein n=1 Tax=Chelonoidis abingdonii TaxID=106734 RepID=A0A8C0HED1_CHEAB
MKAPSFWIALLYLVLPALVSSHWQTGEPNGEQKENCALARQDGHWYDVPCTEQHHWVCEKEP